MYPDSGYKLAHAQSVCTRPFSPRWEGPGDEAILWYTNAKSYTHCTLIKLLWARVAVLNIT